MKVQVNMEEDMVKRIDAYAKKMGVSRSAWCAVMIGQALMAMDRSMTVLEKMSEGVQLTLEDAMRDGAKK